MADVVDADTGAVLAHRVKVVSDSYCRECKAARSRYAYRAKVGLAGMSTEDKVAAGLTVQVACAACDKRTLSHWPGILAGVNLFFCRSCHGMMDLADGDYTTAMSLWRTMRAEIQLEAAEVTRAMETGRRRRPHSNNLLAPAGQRHLDCVINERAMAKVVVFLARSQARAREADTRPDPQPEGQGSVGVADDD